MVFMGLKWLLVHLSELLVEIPLPCEYNPIKKDFLESLCAELSHFLFLPPPS